MGYKKIIPLQPIYIWAGLTILFGMIQIFVNSPWDFPTFILVVITSAITIWLFVRGIYRNWKQQRALKELFTWGYEQNRDEITYALKLKKSPQKQDIKITLELKASITLQFIVIGIEGNGVKPEIFQPYDHRLNIDHEGIRYFPLTDGGINLTFLQLSHRTEGQHIYVGMKCIAKVPFQGELRVYLKGEEVKYGRNIKLPLQVD